MEVTKGNTTIVSPCAPSVAALGVASPSASRRVSAPPERNKKRVKGSLFCLKDISGCVGKTEVGVHCRYGLLSGMEGLAAEGWDRHCVADHGWLQLDPPVSARSLAELLVSLEVLTRGVWNPKHKRQFFKWVHFVKWWHLALSGVWACMKEVCPVTLSLCPGPAARCDITGWLCTGCVPCMSLAFDLCCVC